MSPIMGLLPGRPTESLRPRLRRDRPDPVGRTSQIHRNPRTTPPLPEGPFEVIYADPPWQLGNPSGQFAPENHYPTLSKAELAQFELPVAPAAVLFLWAVNCELP